VRIESTKQSNEITTSFSTAHTSLCNIIVYITFHPFSRTHAQFCLFRRNKRVKEDITMLVHRR